jgi:hypothetical protein
MTDVRDDDAVERAEAPEQQAAPDPYAAWTGYTDQAVIEMRQWDGIENVGGIATSATGRELNDRWRQLFGPVQYGDYISRNVGDPNRANWWFTPKSVIGQRYK